VPVRGQPRRRKDRCPVRMRCRRARRPTEDTNADVVIVVTAGARIAAGEGDAGPKRVPESNAISSPVPVAAFHNPTSAGNRRHGFTARRALAIPGEGGFREPAVVSGTVRSWRWVVSPVHTRTKPARGWGFRRAGRAPARNEEATVGRERQPTGLRRSRAGGRVGKKTLLSQE